MRVEAPRTRAQILDDASRSLIVRSAMAVAVEVPALLLAQQPGLVGRFGLGLALLAVLSPRFGRWPTPSVLAVVAIHLVGLMATLGLFLLIAPFEPPVGEMISLAFLGLAVPRLWFGSTVGSRTLVLGFALMALMGLSAAISHIPFGLAVGLFLISGLIATLRAHPTWPALLRHVRGITLPLVVTLLFGGGLMLSLAWALPAAEPIVSKALQPWLDGEQASAGFGSGNIRLGKIAQINQSDRLVLRVHGAADYLRGQVYVTYNWGNWARRGVGFEPPRETVDGAIVLDDRPIVRTLRVESEPDAAVALFAPLRTASIISGPAGTRVDAYGVISVPIAQRSEPLVWTLGLAATPRIEPPSELDLRLPERVRDDWEALAAEWAPAGTAPRQAVSNFMAAMRRDFRYSLTLPVPPPRADPVLHFARTARYGHCEYFASALVLLARSQNIPARMVTGFRVFEQTGNGWAIVRDRDAHAWAEVWLDGQWQTVEPTPPGSLAGENLPEPGWLADQWDAFKRALRRAVEWLGDLTARELVPVGAAIIALIGLLVWIRRRRPPTAAPIEPGFAPLVALEAHLDGLGISRAPHETLRRFADATRAAGQPEAAQLIEECARWIYAERGDPVALAAAINAWTQP